MLDWKGIPWQTLKKAVRNKEGIELPFQYKVSLSDLQDAIEREGHYGLGDFLDQDQPTRRQIHVFNNWTRSSIGLITLDGNVCKSIWFGVTRAVVDEFDGRISNVLAALGKAPNFKEKPFQGDVPLWVLQEAVKAIKGCSVERDAKEGDKLHILKGGEFVAMVEAKNGLCHRISFADTKENTELLKKVRENIKRATSTLKGIEKITRQTENTPDKGASILNTKVAEKRWSQVLTPFQRKIHLSDMRRAAEIAGYSLITKLKQIQVIKKGAETPIGRMVLNGAICKGITDWTDEDAVKEFGRKIEEALKQLAPKKELRELFDKNQIDLMRIIGEINYSKDTGLLSIGPTNQVSAHIIFNILPGLCEKVGQERKDDVRVYYILGQAEKPLLIMRLGKHGKEEYVTLTFTNVPQNKEFVLDCIGKLSKVSTPPTKRS